ncbi:MAG: LacI family transcriptional regulator [Ruminiclostridium sp.]|nr:LacI family transcriptional regulator [Ruminiclostridium sp.]
MEKPLATVKKATIYDIARKVGTSAATVSRVLSKSGYPVKEELSRKIFETASKMNYSTNMVGRMLKKSESKDIGVIIPTISNPFYPQVVLGIELEARHMGFNILLCNSFRDASTEKKYIESLYQKQIRGLIISSIDENHLFLKEMQENGVRIVVLDQGEQELKCGKVGFNYIQSGLIAVEYLFRMGHRNIAFITSPLTKRSRRETLEGYKLAFLKKNLAIKEENILAAQTEEESYTGTYEFENGRRLTKKFLELRERPTAIFAVNDMTALGIIHELLNNGVRVPEDVSVIGFDNIEVSSMINPPLTTVNQPSFETGRLACKLLLDSMDGREAGDISITLEPTLVERKSVCRKG